MRQISVTIQMQATDEEIGQLIGRIGGAVVSDVKTPAIAEDVEQSGTKGINTDVETDARGVPWIEEIHAGTKGINKDGSWKRRKGVDKDHCEAVEKAALEALRTDEPQMPTAAPAPQMPTAAPAPQMPTAAPAPQMPTAAPAPQMPIAAPAPQMPTAAPAQNPQAAAAWEGAAGEVPAFMQRNPDGSFKQPPASNTALPPVSYEDLVNQVTALMNNKLLTMEDVSKVYTEAGVNDPNELVTSETLRAKVKAGFDQYGTIQ
jgi:hypothetical protein